MRSNQAENIIKALKIMNDETSLKANLDSWRTVMLEKIDRWLSFIPSARDKERKEAINSSPTRNFFCTELDRAITLADMIICNLEACKKLIISSALVDPIISTLINTLRKGEIPKSWVRYKTPVRMSIDEFLSDFGERVRQIQQYAESSESMLPIISIGKLLNIVGFLTALRQETARLLNVKLEELCFECYFNQPKSTFYKICGLKIQGAIYENGRLVISDKIEYCYLPELYISWKLQSEQSAEFKIPVFFSGDRDEVVFRCTMPSDANVDSLIKRNVALFL